MIYKKSNAKINLFLEVLNRREDGYHELKMVMQEIDLFDEIYLEKADGIEIECNIESLPCDSRNLAYKAARLIMDDFPEIAGVKIKLVKNIPIEAGLAGGSSNAAAVIEGMDELFCLSLSQDKKNEYAASLGSDLNFFLYGGTCLAEGRGEIITKLKSIKDVFLVLTKPKFGLSTAKVYGSLDLKKSVPRDISEYLGYIERDDKTSIIDGIYNKLEESSFRMCPELEKLKKTLEKLNPATMMSGSGPTIFSLFTNYEEAKVFYDKIKEVNEETFITKFI